MKELKTVITAMSVYRDGDNPMFGESSIVVRLEDEAGGAYIVLSQDTDDHGFQEMRFDMDELKAVYKCAKKLLESYNEQGNV